MKGSTATSSSQGEVGATQARTGSSSSTDDHFRLDGPSRPIDERINAWRNDLADISLAGRIFAPHYARPLPRACGAFPAMVWPGPMAKGDAVSQLLPGEGFAVLEYAGGWAWGLCTADHVVGYVAASSLVEPAAPTHIVDDRVAPLVTDESTAPLYLPMGSRLHGRERGDFLDTEYGRVALAHLRRIGDPESDPVAVAQRLIDAPFLPGGRTADGIDQAGLVQLALALGGIEAPRLLDQLSALGSPVSREAGSRRGDLVLFDGGAGLMVDDRTMIHASRTVGKVVVEPVAPYATESRRLPL